MNNKLDAYKYAVTKKIKLIKEKGCKCEQCGIDLYKTPWLADFHHNDPNTKEFTISSSKNSFQKMLEEVKKCKLLCCSCHRTAHSNIDRFNELKDEIYSNVDIKYNEENYFGTPEDEKNIVALHSKGYNIIQISQELFKTNKHRHFVRNTLIKNKLKPIKKKTLIDKIIREDLIQMLIDGYFIKDIAIKYDTTERTIYTIIKKLNIIV